MGVGPPADHFVPYGPSHWVLIVLLVGGSVVVAVFGHRHRDVEPGFRRGFAGVVLAFNVPLLVYRQLPAQWDIAESLPLHLCDLAWMAAAVALWTRHPLAYALTFYWGLTLTPQAMITPALDAPDFPHVDFVEFWGQHLVVVWAAAYLTWGAGLRPTWREYWFAAAVTCTWVVAMLAFNAWAGTNYGFVSGKPENPSLLDLLGGWPWYLFAEVALALAAWALLTWPWTRVRAQGMAKPC
ncbi:TIGR02206 family membrane protein [Saccharopolyspora thermophila]|uniref:TIGR02206 family membrane protein n=1 Tax=Saccharopolyspora thermophila TaxID=89367 RepID=A0ABN1CBR4_9PSEU